jgi:hypothetical protein
MVESGRLRNVWPPLPKRYERMSESERSVKMQIVGATSRLRSTPKSALLTHSPARTLD